MITAPKRKMSFLRSVLASHGEKVAESCKELMRQSPNLEPSFILAMALEETKTSPATEAEPEKIVFTSNFESFRKK